jgi:hypothetical protein
MLTQFVAALPPDRIAHLDHALVAALGIDPGSLR